MKVTYVPLPLALFVCAAVLIASSSPVISLQAQTAGAPGGFVEPTSTQTTRPRLSASQIAGFMPARGLFSFPAPYNTQGVRLTNGSDCGGSDCVLPIGYSYWRRINNHAGSSTLYAVLTLDRNRGGGGPTLFAYNKSTGNTVKVGPLFDASSGMSWAHGEMFYFSATRPTAYYIHEGPRLMRYDILSRATEVVADVSGEFGSDKYIWQPSSSDDDRVHAFTLRRDGDWATVGCVVYDEGSRAYRFFGQAYELDECQIDRSGRFLVIKDQVDGADGEDNVIVDLATGAQRVLLDPQGAGGHSDLGHGYMVAEDNWNQLPGSARLWRLDQDPSAPGNGRLVFHATDWNWGMNHITHTNARAGVAPEQQMACSSETTRMSIPHGNELICYKLDGSLQVLVVAPVMTDLDASGGGDDYYKAPKANLDVTGDFMIWTSNMGGDRLDAFIVRVPKELLGLSSSSPSPSPTPSPSGGCTTPDPFVSLGGGTCVNGNWLPPGMAGTGTGGSGSSGGGTGSDGSCTTADPFVSLGGGTCVNGNWLPPGMSGSGSTGTGSSGDGSTGSGGGGSTGGSDGTCATADPFASLGGGTCVNGNWLPPGMGGTSTPTSPTSPTSPTTGCTTPRPAANWTCDAKTGNWLPPGWGGTRP